MKFVILAIVAIFVAQFFHIGGKIPVTFAIFAKFADISNPFSTFSLSKEFCEICYSCNFTVRKILVTFAIFAKFADISKPFLTLSLSKCRILGNLLFLLFLPYWLLKIFI